MTLSAGVTTVPIHVGGKACHARSGETIDALNPATGEVIARFPRCGAEDVDDAVSAATAAFPGWRALSALERAECVRGLGELVVEHAEELALLDVTENGSPIREMRNDAFMAAAALRYFAGLTLELRGETIPGEFDRLDYTLRQPFGVVGRIVPFNHPLLFAAGRAGAALIAGNTMIVKPSEHTSLSALRLGELADEAFPPGVFNVITGYGDEAGDALVVHRGVRRLAFTGSVEIGRAIQRSAATHVVKTVTLELGGKNPIVILPDADLDVAIEGALRGMNFTWQGQSCGSTSRLIVHRSLHAELVERLGARMEAMRSGLPSLESTDTGAIVHRRQYEKVLGYIEVGRRDGARLVTGGGPPEDADLAAGMFIRPTLFDGVRADSRIAQEEIFGPVLVAIEFDTYEQALQIANDIPYGLTASVFTRDLRAAHRFARDVEAGFVWINDSSKHFPGVPFGGFKDSGIGREESFDELLSYTQIKNVNVNLG